MREHYGRETTASDVYSGYGCQDAERQCARNEIGAPSLIIPEASALPALIGKWAPWNQLAPSAEIQQQVQEPCGCHGNAAYWVANEDQKNQGTCHR